MDTLATLITLAMILINAIRTAGDCPRSCECKWRSGKESVFCVEANMTQVPRHLDSGTQVLVLTGNGLRRIGADEFFNASLLNLQKVFLSRCKLEFIHRFSFRKIINLVELDLSHNRLSSVPSHTFEFIKELRELRLNGNPIVRLLSNAFRMVPRLTKLDLSECRIVHVETKAFLGLERSLEWLRLDKNNMTDIKPQILLGLGNLHGLELAGNPWNCSCGLRSLREWMLRQNVPHSVPPICEEPPRLSGKLWDKLELDEFACTPKIEATAPSKSGEEGSNVTMSCSIKGVPEPSIRWLRKNHVIGNISGAGSGGRKKLYLVQMKKETSSLTILAADAEDNGVYVCRAENKAGRSEANITLTVVVRRGVRIWSVRVMIAVGVVCLLFATAVGLLTYCAWSLRKRKWYVREGVTRREAMDGHEMNHKSPMDYEKMNCWPPGATQGARQVKDGDSAREESEGSANEKLGRSWAFSRMSEAEDGGVEGGSRGQETPPRDETCSEPLPLSSALLGRPHHIRETSIFFTSAAADAHNRFPDLLELSRTKDNFINNNNSTLPPKKSSRPKGNRRGSFGSDSQSPLLPPSSGDSCDSNGSFGGHRYSLPPSPPPAAPDVFARSPRYRPWEAHKFLEEYRQLQEQLFRMKESCENLRFREGEGQGEGEGESGAGGVYVDEANNVCGGRGYLEEDNNNAGSVVGSREGWWSPGGRWVEGFSAPECHES